ncbi:DUF3327 domain-containing protein [Microlunatus elymi]|uniref:DUF3327 domain-containing protein n=1 Tax=Microlunatus elymi TaxID=2596828 RepID=A0A516Q3T7_9ACTN|nr:enterochelin esterase domain-containing protein [Microlunatus elymi]QDP98089.1 DUF3327 domain-containing protein [Microlunatus elymi]
MASTSPLPERVVPARVGRLLQAAAGTPVDRRARLIAAFCAAAGRSGTPLVDPVDGDPYRCEVTFLWRGEADGVGLVMSGLPRSPISRTALERVPGTDLWYAGYRLRSDHRASYRFAVRHGSPGTKPQDESAQWRTLMRTAVADPLNPNLLPGRWGQNAASVFALPDAPAESWTTVDHGRVDHEEVDQDRPVLVLCDGDRWFGELGLQRTLDRMINSGALPPVVVLAPDAVDLDTRWRELTTHHPYLDFLADELLGWAAERWRFTGDPARTVIAGQSLGGLTALYAGLRRPDRFGVLLGQSPSLWWHSGRPVGNPHPAGVDNCWLADRFAEADTLPFRVDLQGRPAGRQAGRPDPRTGRRAAPARRAGHPYRIRRRTRLRLVAWRIARRTVSTAHRRAVAILNISLTSKERSMPIASRMFRRILPPVGDVLPGRRRRARPEGSCADRAGRVP